LNVAFQCHTCGYVRIYRDQNGRLRELFTKKPHEKNDCHFSEPFSCKDCGNLIYLDRKILSPTGREVPLNQGLDTYHFCQKKDRPATELRFLEKMKRGRVED
jgi:predicted nucleic-acid-binding Zn-ribbon protein